MGRLIDIKELEQKYPEGTIIYSVYDKNISYEIIYPLIYKESSLGDFVADSNNHIVWSNGIYARIQRIPIAEMTKEKLLAYANKHYPIGTIYKSQSKPSNEAKIEGLLTIYTHLPNGYQITDGCGGSVYVYGKWAEIISKPKHKFTENDYVLTSSDKEKYELLNLLKENEFKIFEESLRLPNIGAITQSLVTGHWSGIDVWSCKLKNWIQKDDFIRLVTQHNPQKITSMYHHITRQQLKQIYNIACHPWKDKIERLALEIFKDPLSVTGDINNLWVIEMFKAADTSQKELLTKIFPEYEKGHIPKGEFAWVRDGSRSHGLWQVRYSAGDGSFYDAQLKQGTTTKWEDVKPFNEIPF